MAGYPVIDPGGVDIINVDGTTDHYNVGDIVPLSKLISRRFSWLVERGYLSDDFSETFDDSLITGDLRVNGRIGINTDPTSPFHVLTPYFNLLRFTDGNANETPQLSISSVAGKSIQMHAGTGGAGFAYDSTGFFVIGSSPKGTIDGGNLSSTTARLTIDTGGNTTLSGALNVGTTATVLSTTDSTTSTTGALTVAGGVGIAKALHVGSTLAVDTDALVTEYSSKYVGIGTTNPNAPLHMKTRSTGVTAEIRTEGFDNSTASKWSMHTGGIERFALSLPGASTDVLFTSTTSGGRNAGFQFLNGGTPLLTLSNAGLATVPTLNVSATTDSTTSTTGALTVAGGVGIAKKMTVADTVTIKLNNSGPTYSGDYLGADGTFDTSTGWTLNTGLTISGGALNIAAGASADGATCGTTMNTLGSGNVYLLTISGTRTSGSGTVYVYVNELYYGAFSGGTDINFPAGHYTANPTVKLSPTSTFEGTIDTITLQLRHIHPYHQAYLSHDGTGSSHVHVGDYATGFGSQYFGRWAGSQALGTYNTAYGYSALRYVKATFNTAIGSSALANLSYGDYNTALGESTATALITGTGNIAIGSRALRYSRVCSNNIAIGYYSQNTANDSGSYNVTTGAYSGTVLANASTGNSFYGDSSGRQWTTGSNNSLFGRNSGYYMTSGSYNTAFGMHSMLSATSGSYNTVYGYYAGSASGAMDYSTIIGANASVFAPGSTHEVVIGYGAVGKGSGTTVLGSTTHTTDFYPAGKLHVESTTDSTSTTTGAIQTLGGVGIAKSLHVGKGGNFNSYLSTRRLGQPYVRGLAEVVGLASQTGAQLIQTNLPRTTSGMYIMRVHGWHYAGGRVDFTIRWYQYQGQNDPNGSPGAFYAPQLHDWGTDGLTKQIGMKGDKVFVAVGDVGVNTSYLKFQVDCHFVNGSPPREDLDGWTVTTNNSAGGTHKFDADYAPIVLTSQTAPLLTSTQTIVGAKTFSDNVTISSTLTVTGKINSLKITQPQNRSIVISDDGTAGAALTTGGDDNIFIGKSAGDSVTNVSKNVFIGSYAGRFKNGGADMVAIGYGALGENVVGTNSASTAVGRNAMYSGTSGHSNTALGYQAGYGPNGVTANATTTGHSQTLIGRDTGQGSTTARNYILCLGRNATVDGDGAVAIGTDSGGVGAAATAANQIMLGTANHTVSIPGASVELGASGPTLTTGTGTPEAVVTAPVGSMYTRTDGGAGTTLYIKESGTGNTGWVAK